MEFFAGVLVGQRGGVITVEVKENARAGTLRRAFIDEINQGEVPKRVQCPPDLVRMYPAKTNGSWLKTNDSRVKQLCGGDIPDGIKSILSGEPIDPTSYVHRICSGLAPEKAIQILVVTPDCEDSQSVGIAEAGTETVAHQDHDKPTELQVKAERVENNASTNGSASEVNTEIGSEAVEDVDSRQSTKNDKGDYKVGDLKAFVFRMAQLHANRSLGNDCKLVGMMKELFNEPLLYRSDVEASGLAAVVAMLRTSSSCTVSQTASSLRKHSICVLKDDSKQTRVSKKQKR